jgi:hypothetical protein
MNALPHSHGRPRHRAGHAHSITALVCAPAPAAAAAEGGAPPPGSVPRCAACVVAVPELIDLAGAALAGANAGEAIDDATRAVEDAGSVRTGVRVAKHPGRFRPWIRWANGNMRVGRSIWRASRGRLGRIYRSLRRTYTLQKLRKKLPRAAIACVVSGTVTGIHRRSARDAAWSCLGAALGALTAAKSEAPVHRSA